VLLKYFYIRFVVMARKKYEEEHHNNERWLISYADFITLLFALFVVLYALSSINEGKYRVLSNALGNAFSNRTLPDQNVRTEPLSLSLLPFRQLQLASPKLLNKAELRREREYMTGIARNILKVLAPLVREGKVRVSQNSRGVSVEINASVLFSPGDAKLTSESEQALRAVALVLKSDQHAIQVEGHTDVVPISNASFPSNWELSAVRASSVVRLFMDGGINESRLTAVGHGPTQPISNNETSDGRARNRRVEVTILSALPDAATEVPVSAVSRK
jgi:chemotaxis protein MotB